MKKEKKLTEIVQFRIEPKTKYLAELAARKMRITFSDFVRYSIKKHVEVQS